MDIELQGKIEKRINLDFANNGGFIVTRFDIFHGGTVFRVHLKPVYHRNGESRYLAGWNYEITIPAVRIASGQLAMDTVDKTITIAPDSRYYGHEVSPLPFCEDRKSRKN